MNMHHVLQVSSFSKLHFDATDDHQRPLSLISLQATARAKEWWQQFPPYEMTQIPWPVSKSSNLVYLFVYYFDMSHAYICVNQTHTLTYAHMIYYTYVHIHLLVHHHMCQNLWLNASCGPDFWAYLSSAADVYHIVLIILITCIITNCYMISLQLNTSFSPRRSQNTVTCWSFWHVWKGHVGVLCDIAPEPYHSWSACCAGLWYIHNTYVL